MLVDVRELREFATGHLEGAVNIPVAELKDRLREIPPDVTPRRAQPHRLRHRAARAASPRRVISMAA